MYKNIQMLSFMQYLFDDPRQARRAAEIGEAMLKARSVRLSEVAARMRGNSEAAYKRIQRFLHRNDPREALWRLLPDQAEFVIGDITEIERPQARKTAYVGTLKDGKSKGFWLMVLATPYRGRAIPCGMLTFSSRTIAERGVSRNRNHGRAFAQLQDLLDDRPLVLDREFSYLGLLEALQAEGIHLAGLCPNRTFQNE